MSIITLTLNPCIDKSTSINGLKPEQKLRCAAPKFEPGGGGINVSRAIQQLGGVSDAIYMSGAHTGVFFESLMQQEQINSHVIKIKGTTRENFIVVDEATNLQYRFGMDGPTLLESELNNCISTLSSIDNIKYLVASGSIPSGVPNDFYARVAVEAKRKNARFILDTSGEALREAADEGVYLLKPNLSELSALAGVAELAFDDVDDAALQLVADGKCEVVVVSLGAGGAMLVAKNLVKHIAAPPVKVRGTVGAGDSMVAGMVLSLQRGWDLESVVRYGVACGSAATMSAGTGLCQFDDVTRLYALIQKRKDLGII
jgi:6-phosphofructokinase 2